MGWFSSFLHIFPSIWHFFLLGCLGLLLSLSPSVRIFPIMSSVFSPHSWGSACCRVQPAEQFPWKKWRSWVSLSLACSPALCLTYVTSSHSPCLLLSLLSLTAIRAARATSQRAIFRRHDHFRSSRRKCCLFIIQRAPTLFPAGTWTPLASKF